MTLRQIVEDRDFIAFVEQLFDANAADVTCSASDKNGFHGGGMLSGSLGTINSGKELEARLA